MQNRTAQVGQCRCTGKPSSRFHTKRKSKALPVQSRRQFSVGVVRARRDVFRLLVAADRPWRRAGETVAGAQSTACLPRLVRSDFRRSEVLWFAEVVGAVGGAAAAQTPVIDPGHPRILSGSAHSVFWASFSSAIKPSPIESGDVPGGEFRRAVRRLDSCPRSVNSKERPAASFRLTVGVPRIPLLIGFLRRSGSGVPRTRYRRTPGTRRGSSGRETVIQAQIRLIRAHSGCAKSAQGTCARVGKSCTITGRPQGMAAPPLSSHGPPITVK
jgi:hypothetical protein